MQTSLRPGCWLDSESNQKVTLIIRVRNSKLYQGWNMHLYYKVNLSIALFVNLQSRFCFRCCCSKLDWSIWRCLLSISFLVSCTLWISSIRSCSKVVCSSFVIRNPSDSEVALGIKGSTSGNAEVGVDAWEFSNAVDCVDFTGERYLGGGDGGLGVPVVSYAPRPMTDLASGFQINQCQ